MVNNSSVVVPKLSQRIVEPKCSILKIIISNVLVVFKMSRPETTANTRDQYYENIKE